MLIHYFKPIVFYSSSQSVIHGSLIVSKIRDMQGQNYFCNSAKTLFACLTVLEFVLMVQKQ